MYSLLDLVNGPSLLCPKFYQLLIYFMYSLGMLNYFINIFYSQFKERQSPRLYQDQSVEWEDSVRPWQWPCLCSPEPCRRVLDLGSAFESRFLLALDAVLTSSPSQVQNYKNFRFSVNFLTWNKFVSNCIVLKFFRDLARLRNWKIPNFCFLIAQPLGWRLLHMEIQ